MDEQLKAKLKEWAGIYNVRSFISDDPVQFPHRFTEKRDIEISAFITSWISYGRRELILRKADWLHSRMGGKSLRMGIVRPVLGTGFGCPSRQTRYVLSLLYAFGPLLPSVVG